MDHLQRQKDQYNKIYSTGSRQHVVSDDIAINYIITWRIKESLRRVVKASNGYINNESSILTMCSGEGMEGSILCDLGFTNVTVSDLSENGINAALQRDNRLKGIILNAEKTNLDNEIFDLVIVQDGLHHLPSPIQGFTEMLRIAKKAIVFLEPHDSFVGRAIGTKWETNGAAINYVFRWNRELVEQVASSYLGRLNFENISFSFWHHNPVYAKIAKVFGSVIGLYSVKVIKLVLDVPFRRAGNQFCGLILKRRVD